MFYFIALLVVWVVVWRPDMVEWWRERDTRRHFRAVAKAELQELRQVTTVDDMFGEEE